MSNLIKGQEYLRFKIASFEAEEIPGGRPATDGGGSVVLPIGKKRDRVEPKQDEKNIHERLAALEREAYEKGFEQGQKDGLSLGEKRVEQTLRQLEEFLQGLSALKERIYSEAEGELLELSMEIAGLVIKKEIETDPEVVVRSIRSALSFLVDRSRIRVLISPEDAGEVQRRLPEFASAHKLDKLQVVEDQSLQRGGCLIETGFGRINATIEDQLSHLRESLREQFEADGQNGRKEGE